MKKIISIFILMFAVSLFAVACQPEEPVEYGVDEPIEQLDPEAMEEAIQEAEKAEEEFDEEDLDY